MAKARKLPSGRWNIQVHDYTDDQRKEHRRSFTADTKAEVEFLAAEFTRDKELNRAKKKTDLTVGDAVDKYIALSAATLSPTTLHRYKTIKKSAFPGLMGKKITGLTDEDMQEAINAEVFRPAKDGKTAITAKTVANEWGLISTSLKTICGRTYQVKLPKRQRGEYVELPDPQTLVAMFKGSGIELPCLLALWLSFSLSEVMGLMCSDVQGDLISINRVKVSVGGKPEVKENAKVDTRKRTHRLPPYLKSLITESEPYKRYIDTGEDEFLVQLSDYALRYRLQVLCEKNDIKGLTFHKLRHINASVMLMLNIPDKYAMERGGWKTPYVMHEVYQHTFSAERQKVDAVVDKYFQDLVNTASS